MNKLEYVNNSHSKTLSLSKTVISVVESTIDWIWVLCYHISEANLLTWNMRFLFWCFIKNGSLEIDLVWPGRVVKGQFIVVFRSQYVTIVRGVVVAFVEFVFISRVSCEESKPECPVFGLLVQIIVKSILLCRCVLLKELVNCISSNRESDSVGKDKSINLLSTAVGVKIFCFSTQIVHKLILCSHDIRNWFITALL